MRAFLATKLTRGFVQQPLFVVGTGRSGTTIVLQALGAHPLIFAATGEAPLISLAGDFIAAFDSKAPPVRAYLDAATRLPRESIYAFFKRLMFETAFGPHYGLRRVVKRLLAIRMAFFRQRYWAAKVFPSEEACRGLRCLYPEARFVYVIRDGIRVVQSRMHFSGFQHGTFSDHCHNWQSSNEKFAYLEHADYAVRIYHEQLLDAPDRCMETVFSKLNIPSHNAPGDYVRNNLLHPLDEGDQTDVDARQVLRDRPAAWEQWTQEQKSMFIDICSEGMKSHGYDIPFV